MVTSINKIKEMVPLGFKKEVLSKKSKNKHELDCYEDQKSIPINCSALSEDGSLLVTGREDGSLILWSARTNSLEQLGTFQGHTSYVTCCTIQDMFIVTGSADGTIRKWDLKNTEDPCVFVYEGHAARINSVIATDDYIFSSSSDKTARVWIFDGADLPYSNPEKAAIRIFDDHNGPVYSIIFLSAPDEVVTYEEETTVQPFATKNLADSRPVSHGAVENWADWGDVLITGCADGIARTWSVDAGSCVKQYRGHTASITCLAVNHQRDVLFTGSADGTICSWDLFKGKLIRTFSGHGGPILDLFVDKKLLYSASSDKTVRAWVSEFGDCTRVLQGHKRSVTTVQLHYGIVFTGCGDGKVRAYEAKSGSLLREFRGHSATVTSVVFVKGKLFSMSVDGSVRLWDAMTIGDIGKSIAAADSVMTAKQKKSLEGLERRLSKVMVGEAR